MFFTIGLHISQSLLDPGLIVSSILYGIIIVLTLITTIYQYHYDQLDSNIFTSPFYLYNILSPAVLLVLPLVQDTNLIFLIYAVPLAILLIIVILNRQDRIFTVKNCLFYLV